MVLTEVKNNEHSIFARILKYKFFPFNKLIIKCPWLLLFLINNFILPAITFSCKRIMDVLIQVKLTLLMLSHLPV